MANKPKKVSRLARLMISKETKRKEEYNKYAKEFGLEHMGPYAAWEKQTYGKYEKAPSKPSLKRAANKPTPIHAITGKERWKQQKYKKSKIKEMIS